ncbi:MAG: divalent metal cation transporter, partial [Halococcoides sp.]
AAQALGPIAGENAKWLFLIGLAAAAVSTLGGNTIVPPFLIADKLGWETSVSDNRYRALLVVVALLSIPGAAIPGAIIGQLVLVLAVGTVGTPFAIAIVLYLLNSGAVSRPTSPLVTLGGVGLLALTGVLAGNFAYEQITAGVTPLSGAVLAFAVLIAIATVALGGKFVGERTVT